MWRHPSTLGGVAEAARATAAKTAGNQKKVTTEEMTAINGHKERRAEQDSTVIYLLFIATEEVFQKLKCVSCRHRRTAQQAAARARRRAGADMYLLDCVGSRHSTDMPTEHTHTHTQHDSYCIFHANS